MNRWLYAITTAMAVIVLGAAPAGSQELTASLSRDRILIQSNFSGETIAIFGAIDNDAPSSTTYDAVVTVRGPRGAVTIRRKQKWGPFWFNLDNRKYIGIPAFIAIASNRPVDEVAAAEVRDDLLIGIDALIPPQTAQRGANDPEFRAALRRLREEQGLFYEDAEALKFMSPKVFRAVVDLPGIVPLGKYDVDIVVFRAGAMYGRQTLSFTVSKTALEQIATNAARDFPLAYGIVVALMALFMGWLASVIFRRD